MFILDTKTLFESLEGRGKGGRGGEERETLPLLNAKSLGRGREWRAKLLKSQFYPFHLKNSILFLSFLIFLKIHKN